MDATTAQPTLLSAARNFIRKSAGTAAIVIVPLAAVVLAPEAKAQTIFSAPPSGGSLNLSGTLGSFFSGSGTLTSMSYLGDGARFGRSIRFISNVSGGSFSGGVLTIGLAGYSAITPTAGLNTGVDFTYDFTLALDPGLTLNNWQIVAHFADGTFSNLADYTLASAVGGPSGNLTGNGTFLTPLNSNDYYAVDLVISLSAASDSQSALITMGSAQGVTFKATAIPEPSTYVAIFGLGALGFAVLRRSRRVAA